MGYIRDCRIRVARIVHTMPSYFRFRPHDKSRVGWFGTPRARGPLERLFFGGEQMTAS